MRPEKYVQVANRLARRIRKGDYHLHELPSERELAAEAGVSHATARKAVQWLVDQGLLSRQPNGRASVRPVEGGNGATAPKQIVLLAPAWECTTLALWRRVLAKVCSSMGASSRVVLYTHWDDPSIVNTLQAFDGIFIIPEPEPPPGRVIQALQASERPLVVLNDDFSRFGLRSVVLDFPGALYRMLDHLASLGHRKIDYFNVQPGKMEISTRWRLWLAAQHLDGEMIDEPVKPYEEPRPAAYAVIDRLLRAGQFHSKALLCATEPAATGAMAAMLDHGLTPGCDVAVCCLDSGLDTAFCNPSLTSMAEIDREPYMTVCLNWMLGRIERAWPGPLVMQPADCHVVVRQSTAPDVKFPRRLK